MRIYYNCSHVPNINVEVTENIKCNTEREKQDFTKVNNYNQIITEAHSIKVSATLQDRPRADHFSAFIFNTNPYKPYIF